jgi:hypothetical protein
MRIAEWTDEARLEWLARHVRLGQPGPFFRTRAPDDEWRRNFAANHAVRGLPASLDAIAGDGFRALVDAAKTRLERGLLAFGGWAVCQPALDDDLDRVLSRGVLLDGRNAARAIGRQSQCHLNAAQMWLGSPAACGIMTGYGLSSDGMWREHSWIAGVLGGGTPRLAETTERRVAYFGFLRTPHEAAGLCGGDGYGSQAERLADMHARLSAIQPEAEQPPGQRR